MGTLKRRWMVPKKNDTSSGSQTGVGAIAVELEAVAGVGVDELAVMGAAFGVSTLSVVGLLGKGINSPDERDIGVMGSETILDSA
jgi:hypothetical protein